MEERVIARVRVKPYVKRWAVAVFGSEPITVVCNLPTGQTSIFDHFEIPLPPANFKSQDPVLEVSISRRALKDFGHDIRKHGKYLHQQFYMSLFMWTLSQRVTGVPADHGMKSFLETFKIDEDTLSLDTVRRMYQLWKNRTPLKQIA